MFKAGDLALDEADKVAGSLNRAYDDLQRSSDVLTRRAKVLTVQREGTGSPAAVDDVAAAADVDGAVASSGASLK